MSGRLTDAERVAQATYRAPRWYGPIEHAVCAQHQHCLESYRWTWKGERGDIEDGIAELVQDCSECARADDAAVRP